MKFQYQLNFWSTLLLILLILIGLRDKFAVIENTLRLPPHFLQFNMYVWALNSPSDKEKEYADFFIPAINRNFNANQLYEIKPSGGLITSDRWMGDKNTINNYFCAIKNEIGIHKDNNFKVIASYLKNKKEIISINYDVSCSK